MGARGAPYRPEAPIVAELAAGVVLVHEPERHVLLLHQRQDDRWCLPKGHVDPGESLSATALRETREETGIPTLTLGEELGEVSYRFYSPRRRLNVYKSVVYFLAYTRELNVRAESIFDRHAWITAEEAGGMVPFDTDRGILAAAARKLSESPPP